ncbi:MAG: DsbA family protein [Candidatus Colwellbacteria bacterium]|nr:DsbA family protein [Candidatus Colwellbacteria bacterium]
MFKGSERSEKDLESQVEELRWELRETQKRSSNANLIPGTILISGLIIAGALFYQKGGEATAPVNVGAGTTPSVQPGSTNINIKAVTSDDHIRGSLNAPVKIVEFSDLECPFCKSIHPTLQRIFDEYGKNGQVAWVYRHFPLVQLHPKAPNEAAASECAAELGGNEKFWAYIDRLFQVTPSNNGLDPSQLPEIASDVGLNKDAFNNCLNSGKYASKVQDQYNDAVNSGGQGTPYSVVIAKNGKKYPISGAQPYDNIKAVIETALK